jgi:hypothetical protein
VECIETLLFYSEHHYRASGLKAKFLGLYLFTSYPGSNHVAFDSSDTLAWRDLLWFMSQSVLCFLHAKKKPKSYARMLLVISGLGG